MTVGFATSDLRCCHCLQPSPQHYLLGRTPAFLSHPMWRSPVRSTQQWVEESLLARMDRRGL